MREEPLPYFNERETPIDMIVLHCSAYDVETIIHYMHEYQLSAHYIIDEKGEMTKLVDESKRAYHAGTGFWRGEDRSPNARSIGIELVNFSLGQETYAPQQIDTLLNFLPPLIGKYNIRIYYQCPGNSHSLLLSARHLVRQMLLMLSKFYQI